MDGDNDGVATFVIGIGGLLAAKVGGILPRFVDDLSEGREYFDLGDARLASGPFGNFLYISGEEVGRGLVVALSEGPCFVQ